MIGWIRGDASGRGGNSPFAYFVQIAFTLYDYSASHGFFFPFGKKVLPNAPIKCKMGGEPPCPDDKTVRTVAFCGMEYSRKTDKARYFFQS
jgi:hypothetical protein